MTDELLNYFLSRYRIESLKYSFYYIKQLHNWDCVNIFAQIIECKWGPTQACPPTSWTSYRLTRVDWSSGVKSISYKNRIYFPTDFRIQTPYQSIQDEFHDDDPLPAAESFFPVPEVDENVEFQGFFVNPTPPSVESSNDLRNVELKLLSESAFISVGRCHQTYATLLRVKPLQSSTAAPLLEPAHRAPIDLVTVLDLSDGMTGAKLSILKRAVRLVLLSLGSADRLSIVAFSSSNKRLLPLKRMTADGQRAARLVTSHGSNVGEALKKVTKVLEDRRERNPVASILLLSNGHDDTVQIRTNRSHVSSSLIEIPLHSFGLGPYGGYRKGPGEETLAKCVGGLLSKVVKDLRVQLSFVNGGQPTVLDSTSVRLGDLYSGEDRELLVELRVPSTAVGAHHVMSVRSSYKHPATQETYHCKEQNLLVPMPQPVRSSAPKIERLRNLFITTRAIAESRRSIEHGGDYTSAHRLLASARALIVHSSVIAGDEFVRDLESEMAEVHQQRQRKVAEQQIATARRQLGEKEAVVLRDENGEPLTPMSAWRAAEKLAKVAMMKKSMNRVTYLHGFESARF